MAQQDALDGMAPRFDPLEHGLWQRFKYGDMFIDHAAWMGACAAGSHVGTCRRCGDYLVPLYPEQHGNRTDYEARCRKVDPECGWTLSAPGGRILTRSSRHTEMPAGWWERREQQLKTREV